MAHHQNRTTKLNDTQLVLLSAASQRQDKQVEQSPSITARAFARALNGLVKQGLVAGLEPDVNQSDLRDGDADKPAFVITPAGLTSIGLSELKHDPGVEQAGVETAQSAVLTPVTHAASPQQQPTKKALIIALLSREDGATLDELIGATGWLPHTTRAVLTGLRQKGFGIERTQRADRSSVYRITAAAHQGRAA